jgi:Zn-dependent peptidase ImmA (M78 family)
VAARWLSATKALIQLSLRHKTDDHLWFSFFHEAGHLLVTGKRRDFVDSIIEPSQENDDEQKVDHFARDLLIPPADYNNFVSVGVFNVPTIRAFAESLGIAPGIVAGRLQRDQLINHHKSMVLKSPCSGRKSVHERDLRSGIIGLEGIAGVCADWCYGRS